MEVKLARLCLCPAISSASIERLVDGIWITHEQHIIENGLVPVSLLLTVARLCEFGYKFEVIFSTC